MLWVDVRAEFVVAPVCWPPSGHSFLVLLVWLSVFSGKITLTVRDY
ncbi:MAG: hypothetical protein ACREX8_09645 [Gammaproteobacteria bacterium]